jgi:hypothetical protein
MLDYKLLRSGTGGLRPSHPFIPCILRISPLFLPWKVAIGEALWPEEYQASKEAQEASRVKPGERIGGEKFSYLTSK